MVHIIHASCLRSQLGVADEARRRVGKGAGLPRIVGRLTGDQHLGTLGYKQLRSILQVLGEGKHGFLDTVVSGRAGLVACSGTVCTAIIGGGKGAAVVVPELDDYIVAWVQDVCDGLETAFAGIRASTAASNCLVRYCGGDVGGDVLTPSCLMRALRCMLQSTPGWRLTVSATSHSVLGHGRITGHVDGCTQGAGKEGKR